MLKLVVCIKQADRILVLDNGSVVEQGTYSALMAAGAVFRRLVDRE